MIKSFLSFLAQANISPDEIGLKNPIKDPNVALNNVLTVVYFWTGIICVIVIIVAGIFYASSAGNPSQTKRAREAIIYSIVGLVIVMMAFVITQFILGRF